MLYDGSALTDAALRSRATPVTGVASTGYTPAADAACATRVDVRARSRVA